MSKQQFASPVIAPDLLARQLQMQRNGRMAEQVMSQAPLQGQMVSGHYVAPNAAQGIARAIQQFAAYKTMQGLDKEQSDLSNEQMGRYASMFGMGGGQPPAGGSSPQALAKGLVQQGQPAPQNGTQAFPASAQSQQPTQQPRQPQMPMLPGRSAQESFQAFQYLGPQEYMKLVAQQGTPTDIQKNLMAQGIQPGTPQWNQALGASTHKAGYIAPVSAAPGSTLLDPNTMQPRFSAPQNGIQTQYGPDGQATAQAVPGFAGAQAQIAGAEAAATEAARAGMDLIDVPDGQGGKIKMPRSQAIAAMTGNGAGPGAPAGDGIGRTPPERVIAARQELAKVSGQAEQMINSIDGILNHPGLGAAIGASSYLPSIRGTDRADFDARSAQLKGQAFLQAFESLKGGGQITEVEGKAATEAIARLDNAQSEKAYKASLTELRGILEAAKARAYDQAGVPMPKDGSAPAAKPAVAPTPDRNALMEEARRRGLIK